jgi:hypothetical protein
MLLTTYAHWLEGMEDAANKLLDAALAGVNPLMATVESPLRLVVESHGPATGQEDNTCPTCGWKSSQLSGIGGLDRCLSTGL